MKKRVVCQEKGAPIMIDLNQTCFAKFPIMDFRKDELLRVSKLNGHGWQNLPLPLFAKEGYFPSLWKREVRRDFIKQCHYYETVNKSCAFISRRLFLAASDFTPLESPSIYAGDGRNRKHQFLIEGGVKALPFLTGFTWASSAAASPTSYRPSL